MKIVATALIYGAASPLFHMADEQACRDMVETMRADADAAFEDFPFGRTGPSGEIIRRSDYAFECGDAMPEFEN